MGDWICNQSLATSSDRKPSEPEDHEELGVGLHKNFCIVCDTLMCKKHLMGKETIMMFSLLEVLLQKAEKKLPERDNFLGP